MNANEVRQADTRKRRDNDREREIEWSSSTQSTNGTEVHTKWCSQRHLVLRVESFTDSSHLVGRRRTSSGSRDMQMSFGDRLRLRRMTFIHYPTMDFVASHRLYTDDVRPKFSFKKRTWTSMTSIDQRVAIGEVSMKIRRNTKNEGNRGGSGTMGSKIEWYADRQWKR